PKNSDLSKEPLSRCRKATETNGDRKTPRLRDKRYTLYIISHTACAELSDKGRLFTLDEGEQSDCGNFSPASCAENFSHCVLPSETSGR
ncbi:MAG: hypothetical protein LBD80_07565, partial [Tannerella sp.]|nr:hypothetical protein [Tannerella sp.]